MELRSLKDAISSLKEDIKTENQKLLGITLSKSIDAHELQFLEEKIRLHEHPSTNEGDKERLEIERQKKVDSLEENKYNLSSQIRNLENKLESLEERQSENIEESAELKKSRKDHELKKAKIEVCIKEMRAASSSAGGSHLAIFDPLAPKIAARIEEAFRYLVYLLPAKTISSTFLNCWEIGNYNLRLTGSGTSLQSLLDQWGASSASPQV